MRHQHNLVQRAEKRNIKLFAKQDIKAMIAANATRQTVIMNATANVCSNLNAKTAEDRNAQMTVGNVNALKDIRVMIAASAMRHITIICAAENASLDVIKIRSAWMVSGNANVLKVIRAMIAANAMTDI